jgi:hypothetical protein
MNKQEAYEAMLQGYKVRNEYYTPEEYAFINREGLIQLEDGVVAGTKDDEFWAKYQVWDEGWEICGTVVKEEDRFSILANNPPYLITKRPNIPMPDIFIQENKSPIPRREHNPYTVRKPVKRKRNPKTFGKKKKW